jgi:MFS family permease
MEKYFRFYFLSTCLGIAHGLNDFLAGFFLVYFFRNQPFETANHLFYLYILLGFGGQFFTGLLVDYYKGVKALLLFCCFLWFITCFYIWINPFILVLIIGFSSAFIHVLGGSLTLSMQKGKSKFVGIFVSPGVFGLALGGLFAYKTIDINFICILIPSILMLIFLNAEMPEIVTLKVDNQLLTKETNLYLEHKKLKVILVMSILLVIILRSFVWEFGQYLHFGDYKALLTIGFFALLGKSLGGFFSDKMDQWVFLISTWSISIICFLINKDNIIMQSIGFGFLQASLPLSILQLSSFFPNKIGFAVGLALGIGVLIGGIPFLKIDINSISGVVLFGSLVTSLGLILFLKWKSKN